MSKAKAPPRSHDQVDDPVFDRTEAAQFLGVSERWTKDRIADGTIPHFKLNRLVRFRRSQLETYLAEHAIAPGDGS
jgi:excisionase family DNA binding protein